LEIRQPDGIIPLCPGQFFFWLYIRTGRKRVATQNLQIDFPYICGTYISHITFNFHIMLRTLNLLSTGIVFIATIPTLSAQIKQKLKIEEATVFLRGAELTSTANLSFAKGVNEVVFSNVAGNVNSASLVINAGNGAVVESAVFQNNYLAEEVMSPRAKQITDSIDYITLQISYMATKISVLQEQITVLQNNRKVSGDNTGLSVAELTKMLDLIGNKMENYMNAKAHQEELRKEANEYLSKLSMQLDEEKKKGYQPGGQLVVKFYSREAGPSAIHITYVVPGAGWTPTYDIMADDATGPVKIFYKANVYQNSGVAWDNVRLSLSTGNPVEGAQAPALSPWYLSFYVPNTDYQNSYNRTNTLNSNDIKTLPTTEVSDLVGLQPGAYQAQRGKGVSVGGARSSGQVTLNNYVTTDNSGVNTTFDIDLPYTIPSDGKEHLVAIKKSEVPASYRYYVVPKMDKDAFLQAQITGWEDLNLMPGQTNIFYEGSYIGQGYLDMRNVKDTLTLSLGRDKKIVVKRERDTKRRSVKMIGTNVKETFAYSIIARNTRKTPITLIIQDQMPVSNDNEISVEDKDFGGSEYTETTGIMEWTVTAAPNEKKTLNFAYTIKYPKGKTVSGLR
jgi:uncharacterized protein (TIGR02231 family)